MHAEGDGVDKGAAKPHGHDPALVAGDTIVQFAIFCCAVTLVIVLAVALIAS